MILISTYSSLNNDRRMMKKDRFQKWRLLTTGFLNAFENMAIDEAILKSCCEGKSPPTIRFYGWKPLAVSLGYSQQIEDTINLQACKRLEVDVVRRPTGGRAILHDEELTYSLYSPLDNPLFRTGILETYRKKGFCLIEGFKKLNINAQMVPKKEKMGYSIQNRKTPSCFLTPSWYEVMVGGKKICGSAQRRTDSAFLQHGSILLKFDPVKLYETFIFKGLERSKVIDSLNSNITSVNDQLDKDIGFFELQEIFIQGFQKGLDIELQEGYMSPHEYRLKDIYYNKQALP